MPAFLRYERTQKATARRAGIALAAATFFAALTALGARVQVPLPFTPVPVTGQVFCVLLAGGALGARLGFLSQVAYLAAGAAGLPVFAYGGGPKALLGPTGGYLLAFPLAALLAGGLFGRRGRLTRGSALLASLCGVAAIYLLGASWYALWCAAVGRDTNLGAVLAESVLPFLGVDVLKAALAAGLSPGLRRRLPFD